MTIVTPIQLQHVRDGKKICFGGRHSKDLVYTSDVICFCACLNTEITLRNWWNKSRWRYHGRSLSRRSPRKMAASAWIKIFACGGKPGNVPGARCALCCEIICREISLISIQCHALLAHTTRRYHRFARRQSRFRWKLRARSKIRAFLHTFTDLGELRQ